MKFFKLYYLTIFMFLQISSNFQLAADEKWEAFKQEFQKSIYYTGKETLQNFSCYISTDSYLKYLEQNNDTVHTYPLKFIWMKGNKTFYILQPYDNMGDEQKSSKILKQVKLVRKRFEEFNNYWQQFGINSPTEDIPDSAEIIYSADSTVVSYSLTRKPGEE